MDNQEYNTQYGNSTVNNSTTTTDTLQETAEKVGNQVSDWSEKVSGRVGQVSSQLLDRIQNTKGIDKVAMYLREKDSQEMIQDLQQVIRKHPGKSILAGLALGVLVGRVIR